MGYGKFGRKLLATHALMTVIQLFLYLLLFSIFPKNKIYQWAMGLFFIFLFWVVIYADASYYGQNDLKRGTFRKTKGFLSGLIASIPGILLYVGSLIYQPIEIALRCWLIPYVKLFVTFENVMPYIAIVFILMFPVVSGVSYLDGIRRRKKILESIQKKNAMRGELSKRDS